MPSSFVPEASAELALAVLGVVRDAVFVADPVHLVSLNQRAAELMEEEDPSRLVGREFLDFVLPEDRAAIAERARKLFAGELAAPEFEVRAVTLRGNVRLVHVRTVLATIDGRPLAVASLREQPPGTWAGDSSLVGDMATALAHEIRNPLATIANSAASLRRLVPQGDASVLVGCLEDEVGRLGRIVRDLVDFARSPRVLPREEVPVEVALQAVERARERAPTATFRVSAVPGAPPTYPLDAQLVEQALVQLLLNAAQAGPGRAEVVVAVEAEGSKIAFVVQDQGPGLSPEAAERAFQPFYSTRPGATGLGLPIARRIAQAHGGDLKLSPRPGGGTAAQLTLGSPSGRLPGLRPSDPPLPSR